MIAHSASPAARHSRWTSPLLYVAALIFQALTLRRQITYYDEQLELYCAEQVLHGHLPYRDFWTMYGPAQFYALAGFLKVFGISVLAGRIYDALIKAAIALLIYLLVERLATRRAAVFAFAATLLTLTCGTTTIYNFPIFPALLCGLLAVLCLSHFLANPTRLKPLYFAGLLTGLAATFRHDSGLYICLTIIVTIAIATRKQTASLQSIATTRALTTYLSCVLAIFAPVFLWLLAKVPIHDLYYNLIYVPGTLYPRVRSLPFPTLHALWPYLHPFGQRSLYALETWIVYLPILVSITATTALLRTRTLFDTRWQRLTLAALTLLAALLYLKGIVRVTEMHQMQTIVVACAVLSILISRSRLSSILSPSQISGAPPSPASSVRVGSALPRDTHIPTPIQLSIYACTAFLLGYLSLTLWHAETFLRWNVRDLVRTNSRDSIANTCHPPAGFERARCLVVDRATIAAIEYVQHLTTPTDLIYVGATRHDKLSANDVRFYVLSARASVTRWYDLHPGVQTTLPIQTEMIESLRTHEPKVIVLSDMWDDINEPNASRDSSGVTALDDYIRTHYTQAAAFTPYTILVPKGGP